MLRKEWWLSSVARVQYCETGEGRQMGNVSICSHLELLTFSFLSPLLPFSSLSRFTCLGLCRTATKAARRTGCVTNIVIQHATHPRVTGMEAIVWVS